MLLWKKNNNSSSVCRVAIAGDFLPAAGLRGTHPSTWKEAAAGLSDCFDGVDAAILNLECCLEVGASSPRAKLGLGDSFTSHREALDYPLALGARLVGIANNHTYDYGQEGLERTRRTIVEAGLIPLGFARNLSEPPDVAVIEVPSGPRIGFWAAARHLPELATRAKCGVEPATRTRGEAALAVLRDRGVRLSIAFLHAGMEHTNRPAPEDVELMDHLASIGFDIVAACHSHRISGYKRVQRPESRHSFCFYGLGSVSSGVIYTPLEREGLVIVVAANKFGEIVRVEVQPVSLVQNGWGITPQRPEGERILSRFARLSEEIRRGSYKRHFYQDTGRGLFQRQFRDIRAAFQNGGVRGLAKKLGRVRMRHLSRVLHKSLG